CGNGDFSERLYAALNWPPQSLQLTLMEPVPHQRELAALRLARFTQTPITVLTQLPSADSPPYDVILSNHALYYVPDLQQTLTQMFERLAPGGKMLLAMAGWDNALMQLWTTG